MCIFRYLFLGKFISRLFVYALLMLPASAAFAITDQDARLLLTRTGFQPTQAEIAAVSAYPTRAAAVAAVLNGIKTQPVVTPPVWGNQGILILPANYTQDQLAAYRQAKVNRNTDLRSWTMLQMITTPAPLTERLTLFWHNHFTTQATSVFDPWYIWNQDATLRQNAGGNFATMLSQIVHDPAMLLFLSQAQSRATAPIANFARELMELFTLGEGNYTEHDVTEVARALTGLTVNANGQYYYNANIHDKGSKTILGNTGNFGPDDVVNILLANPRCAQLIVTKLWKEFVSPAPDATLVSQIAAIFRGGNYQIKPVLQALFTSSAFWDPNNRGTLVKSPAEFVIGTVRELGLPASESDGYYNAIIWSGQTLYEPPDVRGYVTGTGWINTYTLAGRQRAAAALASLWQTQTLKVTTKALPLVQSSGYAGFANARMGDTPILAPPDKSQTIVQAQVQALSDPAYSLK